MSADRKSSAEQETLETYLKVNPSHATVEEAAEWARYSSRIERRFLDEFRLPPVLLRDQSVLDVGCGTGEKSLVMASWGAKVTGIDFNPKALDRARTLAAQAEVPHRPVFQQESLPDISAALRARSFGLVFADGSLHCLSEPALGMRTVATLVNAGGFLVIRVYHPITSLQRMMKRIIVQIGTHRDPDAITANVQRLFAEDVDRSVATGRGVIQSIHDNFVAPYRPISLWHVLDLCRSAGFEIYSQNPSPEAAALLGAGPLPARPADPPTDGVLWNAVAPARAMVAADWSMAVLNQTHDLLATCSAAERKVEDALSVVVEDPGAAPWGRLVESIDAFLGAYHGLLTTLGTHAAGQVQTFRRDLEKAAPVVTAAFQGDTSVAALPGTEVLFRGLSGFNMATWVLRKVDKPAPSPIRAARVA